MEGQILVNQVLSALTSTVTQFILDLRGVVYAAGTF